MPTSTWCATIADDVIALVRNIGGFLLRALLLALGAAVLLAAIRFGMGYDEYGPGLRALGLPLLVDSFTWVLYPAFLVSFALSLLKLVFQDSRRVLTGVVLFIVAVGVLGVIHSAALNLRNVAPLREGTAAPVVRSGGVTRFPDVDVFVGSRERFSLFDVVAFSREEPRGFAVIPEGFVDPFARTVELPTDNEGLVLDLDSARTGPTVQFRPPFLLSQYAAMIRMSAERFVVHRASQPWRLWAEAAVFVFALAGAWSFAHMSRWPLLNAVVLLAVVLGLPVVHALLYDPDAVALYRLFFADEVVQAAPMIILAGTGSAMQILGLVFPSPRRIQRELEE